MTTKSTSRKSIGFFDSGFGGLTILREVAKVLPDYDYVYLGDTARTPYGTRSLEMITKFTKQAVGFLLNQEDCQLVIIACNTASAKALGEIQRTYIKTQFPDKRVLGVIIPTVEEAVATTKNKLIGVIATEATVISRAFENEIKRHDPDIKVIQNAGTLLVPIVEAGEDQSTIAKMAVQQYLRPLIQSDVDTLILACTHYEILENIIQQEAPGVVILSEGKVVAKKLAEYLQRHPEIAMRLTRQGKRLFYTTDLTDRFKILGSRFFGQPILPLYAHIDERLL